MADNNHITLRETSMCFDNGHKVYKDGFNQDEVQDEKFTDLGKNKDTT